MFIFGPRLKSPYADKQSERGPRPGGEGRLRQDFASRSQNIDFSVFSWRLYFYGRLVFHRDRIWLSAPAPGLQRLLSGLVFPLGLMLVVFAGAELFTGNNAVLIPGALGRRYGWRKVLLNWMLVYAGNFVGSLFFACFLVKLPGMLSAEAWRSAAVGIAEAKVSMPWLTVFLRGVGANWLVCLAVWLGLSANDVAGRLLGLFFPIMCFVAIGYEHSVANMFFIPLGMMHGASVTVSDFLLANLVPATLGNIAGGAVFVGGIYWYINK